MPAAVSLSRIVHLESLGSDHRRARFRRNPVVNPGELGVLGGATRSPRRTRLADHELAIAARR